jgi:hypothetical protein
MLPVLIAIGLPIEPIVLAPLSRPDFAAIEEPIESAGALKELRVERGELELNCVCEIAITYHLNYFY